MDNNEELKVSIDEFIADRLNKNYSNMMKKLQYIKEQKECTDLAKKLVNQCDTNLFEKYKSKNNDLQYLELQEIYKLGFIDSMVIFTSKN